MAILNVPKIHFKLGASKGKKPFKPLEALNRLAYDIKICSKHILKTKAQPGGHLEHEDIVIYAPHTKSRKNKGLVGVLFIF